MRRIAAPRVARPLLPHPPAAPFPRLFGLGLLAVASAGCVFTTDSDHGFHFQIGTSSWGDAAHQATEERRLQLDLVPGDQLVLEGMVADVDLRADGPRTGELVCVLRAGGRTEEEARAALARVELDTFRDGSVVTVRVRSEQNSIELDGGVVVVLSARADLSVDLPVDVRILIRQASGEIEIEGPVANVEAHTAYGDVSVRRVSGRTAISSGSGDLSVREARGGDVSAKTNFGDVELADVEAGFVSAESSSGDIELSSVAASQIRARSSFGKIELSKLSGDVDAETASGDVELQDGAKAGYRLHSSYGQVSAERILGKVHATSDSGDVEIACDGSVEAGSRFGRVRVKGVLTAVDASCDSGDVVVTAFPGSRAERDWSASSGFGDVVLRIASDFACRVEARTEFGDVEDDFGLQRSEEGSISTAGGRIGGGGDGGEDVRRVVLRTGSGDVEIRRKN